VGLCRHCYEFLSSRVAGIASEWRACLVMLTEEPNRIRFENHRQAPALEPSVTELIIRDTVPVCSRTFFEALKKSALFHRNEWAAV
jgi:hypothetical protein